jgi:hypothetical protein
MISTSDGDPVHDSNVQSDLMPDIKSGTKNRFKRHVLKNGEPCLTVPLTERKA